MQGSGDKKRKKTKKVDLTFPPELLPELADPPLEHQSGEGCWCEPRLVELNEEEGYEVWDHKKRH